MSEEKELIDPRLFSDLPGAEEKMHVSCSASELDGGSTYITSAPTMSTRARHGRS